MAHARYYLPVGVLLLRFSHYTISVGVLNLRSNEDVGLHLKVVSCVVNRSRTSL